jgi:hypothetical protein
MSRRTSTSAVHVAMLFAGAAALASGRRVQHDRDPRDIEPRQTPDPVPRDDAGRLAAAADKRARKAARRRAATPSEGPRDAR